MLTCLKNVQGLFVNSSWDCPELLQWLLRCFELRLICLISLSCSIIQMNDTLSLKQTSTHSSDLFHLYISFLNHYQGYNEFEKDQYPFLCYPVSSQLVIFTMSLFCILPSWSRYLGNHMLKSALFSLVKNNLKAPRI